MWQAIASAAANLGGGVLQYFGQKETNEANKQIASDNNAFMANMSNTAYQRAMKDMQAAGLNPILGAAANGGASVPSAQSIAMQNPLEGAPAAMGGAVSSAMQAIQLQKNVQEADSRIAMNAAKATADSSQANLNSANAKSINATIPLKKAEGSIGEAVTPAVKKVSDFVKGVISNSAKSNNGFWDKAAEMYGDFRERLKGRKVPSGN